MKNILLIIIFGGLTNVSAVFSQFSAILPDFISQSANLVFAPGDTILNATGEKLFVLNQKQVNIIYDVWLHAKDEEAFVGKEIEILNQFEGYVNKTDTLHSQLALNTEKSQSLTGQMKADFDAQSERLETSVVKAEQVTERLAQTADRVGENTEKLIKKVDSQRTIIKGLSYIGTVVLGAWLGKKVF